LNEKQIKFGIHLYGSLLIYFLSYSLFWIYIGWGDALGYRPIYSFFSRGIISGFVAVLVMIFFNVLVYKPDVLKGESKEDA